MATHMSSNTLGVSPDLTIRRVSAPHIPLMVVVTDVDEEKQEKLDSSSEEHPGMSKGILKSEKSDSSLNEAGGVSPNLTPKTVSVAVEPEKAKPLAKWKRIAKCFIGFKGHKKNKNSTKAGPSSSKADTIAPSQLSVPPRSRSASLHPGNGSMVGRRISMSSASPSRSILSIKSRLSAKSEADFYLCDMGNMSEILTMTDIKHLGKHFPPSAVGCPVILTYSSSEHGYSLHNLYRKLETVDSPVILAILDSEGRAFGAVISEPPRISEHFYGSSESFLFRCDPVLEVFKWKEGANYYFIHSEENFIRIGAGGKGNCGLWLDDNLFHGRTEECETFSSPPLVTEEDFEVQAVECWTFGHSI